MADDSSSNDPDVLNAISPGGFFFISAKSTDSVGNTITDTTKSTMDTPISLNWEVTSDADNVDDAEVAIVGDENSGTTNSSINIYDKAKLGTYSLTVEDRGATKVVMITVPGKTSRIEITGPDMIPTDTGLATYMVTATDPAGNLPSDVNDLDGNYTVAVRSKDAEVLGLTNDKVDFDEKTGIGQFQVLLPLDAVVGSTVSITISHGTITSTKAVTYGDDPSEPGMPTDGEMLTSPSGVDAASLPGTGTVSVSWTPGQNATQHWVVLFSLPGYDAEGRVEVLNDPDANFQVLRNVPAGEYEAVVASYDPGMGFQYQDGIGMVTVE